MCNITSSVEGKGSQKDSEIFFLHRACALVLCVNCDSFSKVLQIDGHLSSLCFAAPLSHCLLS